MKVKGLFTNIYGDPEIHPTVEIGSYVEIGPEVKVGAGTVIGAFTFIPAGVIIREHCFIGPRVTFCNDKYPWAHNEGYKQTLTVVDPYASIGAGAVILPGITIGRGALVGAGSVVTKDVAPGTTVAGNPAKTLHSLEWGQQLTKAMMQWNEEEVKIVQTAWELGDALG